VAFNNRMDELMHDVFRDTEEPVTPAAASAPPGAVEAERTGAEGLEAVQLNVAAKLPPQSPPLPSPPPRPSSSPPRPLQRMVVVEEPKMAPELVDAMRGSLWAVGAATLPILTST